jgi:hypothetical protein
MAAECCLDEDILLLTGKISSATENEEYDTYNRYEPKEG